MSIFKITNFFLVVVFFFGIVMANAYCSFNLFRTINFETTNRCISSFGNDSFFWGETKSTFNHTDAGWNIKFNEKAGIFLCFFVRGRFVTIPDRLPDSQSASVRQSTSCKQSSGSLAYSTMGLCNNFT